MRPRRQPGRRIGKGLGSELAWETGRGTILTGMDVERQSRRVFGLEARWDASRRTAWLTCLGHRRLLSKYWMEITVGSTVVWGSIGERH